MVVCLTVFPANAENEPSLPPPVFKTAPEDGAIIEAITPYNLLIEWYDLNEYEGVLVQISKDDAFTMLIVNITIWRNMSGTSVTAKINDDAVYYMRIRRVNGKHYSEWVTRSFTFKELVQRKLTVDTIHTIGPWRPCGGVDVDPSMPDGIYNEGSAVTLTARAYPGYKFSRWMPSGETNTTITVVMDQDRMITAEFADKEKFLTISTNPDNGGKIIVNPVMPPEGYPHGSTVNLTAIPEAGYTFSNWEPSDRTTTSLEVLMDSDKEIGAIFEPNKKLTMYVIPEKAGKIITDPIMPTNGYTHGTKVVLTAIPNKGYKFIQWDPTGVTSTVTDIEMSSDKTIAAVFESIPGEVEGETLAEGEATVEGETPAEGEAIVEGETPAEGEDTDDTGEDSSCGGCGGGKTLKDRFGDWLLIGLSLVLLTGMRRLHH